MAISMSGATVDSSSRDSLLSQSIDAGSFGGVTANTAATGFFGLGGREATGANLAGVTAEFAVNFKSAADEYKAAVEAKLNALGGVSSNSAFRGEGVTAALSRFVDSVREVATSYLNKLTEAEIQISESVAKAYSSQDADLSGQMNSDSSSLNGQSAH